MARNIIKVLDIGSQSAKALAAEVRAGDPSLRILGAAMVLTDGLRRGEVSRRESLVPRIKEAMREAERSAGIPFREVYLAFGSAALGCQKIKSRLPVSTGSREITSGDRERVLAEARSKSRAGVNREVLENHTLSFRVDNEPCVKDPLGIQGESLEVEILTVTSFQKPLAEFIRAAEEAGLAIADIIPSPLAAARTLLEPRLAEVGGAALDIGAETTGLAIYEENLPFSLRVFPYGGNHVTHDIAIGFQIPISEAEKIKISGEAPGRTSAAQKKLASIIEARLEDLFELVESHLKKAGRSGLLPGGVFLGGGGARLANLEEFARANLKLPVQTGKCRGLEAESKLGDPLWSVAVGTALLAAEREKEPLAVFKKPSALAQKISSWFKSLIP